jgi:hypothetical protein
LVTHHNPFALPCDIAPVSECGLLIVRIIARVPIVTRRKPTMLEAQSLVVLSHEHPFTGQLMTYIFGIAGGCVTPQAPYVRRETPIMMIMISTITWVFFEVTFLMRPKFNIKLAHMKDSWFGKLV